VLDSTVADGAGTFEATRFVKEISARPIGASRAVLHSEPHIAVDPNDPTVVVAVFHERGNDALCALPPRSCPLATGFATSHDGGRTWITGILPGVSLAEGGDFDRASDPVAAIGPDGAVYVQRLAFNTGNCRSAIAVHRSDDHGLTWGAPVLVQDDPACSVVGTGRNDKDWLAVDTFPGSAHYGRIYSAWDRWSDVPPINVPVVLRYSDDRGVTWSELVTVSPTSIALGAGAIPLVQPNGNLTIVYFAYPIGQSAVLEVSQTSRDGGDHFDAPVTIGSSQGKDVTGLGTACEPPACATATVDPITGYLYAAWQDGRFRSDGQNDVVMSVSTDGATSWGPLRVVNPSRSAPFNYFTPAVAAHGGGVVLTYRSRHEDDPNKVYMRRIASADKGMTFGPEHKLGRRGNLAFGLRVSAGLLFLGDYMGLAATAGAVHAVWCQPSRPPRRSTALQYQTTWSATIVLR
jgi:hypothetical protein